MPRFSQASVMLVLISAMLLTAARPALGAESRLGFLPTCANGKKDGLETGIDCGGLNCPPCGPGQSCKKDKDCQSNQCQGNVCTFGATCNNGIKDAGESGIDCGGIDTGCLRCCWSQTCTLNSDCQSGTCEDGRCGEAKFCATRYLYDNLGVDIQLRTFDGQVATLGPHQEPIKCGQCVCRDCPVVTIYFTFTLSGLCNSTANVARIEQLRSDVIAQAQATNVAAVCVDTTGSAVYSASVCTANEAYSPPLGTKTGKATGCIPAV